MLLGEGVLVSLVAGEGNQDAARHSDMGCCWLRSELPVAGTPYLAQPSFCRAEQHAVPAQPHLMPLVLDYLENPRTASVFDLVSHCQTINFSSLNA